jgi:hypothetical protein
MKDKKQVAQWGKAGLNSVNMYLVTVPNIKVNLLQQIYVLLTESRKMTGVEIWVPEEGWKVVGNIHETFCK